MVELAIPHYRGGHVSAPIPTPTKRSTVYRPAGRQPSVTGTENDATAPTALTGTGIIQRPLSPEYLAALKKARADVDDEEAEKDRSTEARLRLIADYQQRIATQEALLLFKAKNATPQWVAEQMANRQPPAPTVLEELPERVPELVGLIRDAEAKLRVAHWETSAGLTPNLATAKPVTEENQCPNKP
jgi:hypothetical protein